MSNEQKKERLTSSPDPELLQLASVNIAPSQRTKRQMHSSSPVSHQEERRRKKKRRREKKRKERIIQFFFFVFFSIFFHSFSFCPDLPFALAQRLVEHTLGLLRGY